MLLVMGDFSACHLKHDLPNSSAARLVGRTHWTIFILSVKQHIVNFLVLPLDPTYKQKLKVVKPVQHSSKRWTTEATGMLQDCLSTTDWETVRDSIDSYTDTVCAYMSKPVFPPKLG